MAGALRRSLVDRPPGQVGVRFRGEKACRQRLGDAPISGRGLEREDEDLRLAGQ